jgi:hypothetical protein
MCFVAYRLADWLESSSYRLADWLESSSHVNFNDFNERIRKLTVITQSVPNQVDSGSESVKIAWHGVRNLLSNVRSLIRTNFRIYSSMFLAVMFGHFAAVRLMYEKNCSMCMGGPFNRHYDTVRFLCGQRKGLIVNIGVSQ